MPKRTTFITRIYTFDAAHQLNGHEGKCANLHGHTYRLEVTISGPIITKTFLSSHGMVMDYAHLDNIVKPLLADKYDHRFLNDTVNVRTTAENVAEQIGLDIKAALQDRGLPQKLELIKLWETPNACASVDFSDD